MMGILCSDPECRVDENWVRNVQREARFIVNKNLSATYRHPGEPHALIAAQVLFDMMKLLGMVEEADEFAEWAHNRFKEEGHEVLTP